MKTRETPKYGRGELPIEYEPWIYDDMIVGEVFGPIEWQHQPGTHKRTAEKHHWIIHPWFTDESPWGGPVLNPISYDWIRVMSQWRMGRIQGAILASYEFQVFRPVLEGTKLKATCWIANKFKSGPKERKHVIIDAILEAADGELVSFQRADQVLFDKPSALEEVKAGRKTLEQARDESRREKRAIAIEVGNTEIIPATKDIAIGHRLRVEPHVAVDSYEWEDGKWIDNIHTEEYAKKLGYRGAVVGGIMPPQAVHKGLIDFFGEDFLYTGKNHWKMRRPVYVGDVIKAEVWVADKIKEGDGTRIVVQYYLENQEGEKVTEGTASARLTR